MSIYIDEFETLYGISDNIDELRNKIYKLAFEGKLTEETSYTDGSNKLVNKIEKERQRLINEKIISKPRGGLDPIEIDEINIDIPDHWKCLKLGKVVYMLTNRKKEKGELPYLVVKVLRGTKEPKEKNKGQVVKKGDYVILVDGENSGEVFKVNQKGYLGSTLRRLKINKYIDEKYLLLFLKKEHLFLKNNKKGAAIPHLNKTIFRNITFPLPPLEEQKRIVEKIEKLMQEVDKLEDKLKQKEKISEQLSGAISDVIRDSENTKDLEENLKFLIEYFEVIFDSSESMDDIKNIVLQLAIEGKLVPQDENDESASDLITTLQEKKKQKIEKGIISKNRYNIKKIKKQEIRFKIPSKWEWVRLIDVGSVVSGGTPKTSNEKYWNGNISWITPADIQNDSSIFISKGRRNITELGLNNSSAKLIPKGSIVFSSRAPIGKVAIAKNEISTNQGFKSVVPYINDMNKFIYYYLKLDGKRIDEEASGTTFNEISGTKMANLLLPLPPLKEQKRIVEKVESMMNIIDKLEEKLKRKEKIVEELAAI